MAEPHEVELGRSGIRVAPLGVGAMSWANRGPLGYGGTDSPEEEAAALDACLAGGVTLVDTAEMYGRGRSERRVGELARDRPEVVIATKFAPMPYRREGSVPKALARSLRRLGRVDLYQLHWVPRRMSIVDIMRRFADVVRSGQARGVGVSNFGVEELRLAHAELAREGVPLATNQIEYSLLNRWPERSGVIDACRELDVTVVAYGPLAAGALTGRYDRDHRPGGVRRMLPQFRPEALDATRPLLDVLTEIGAAKNAAPSQVALRWLIDQGAVPIPGAKNAAQATSNAGALRITLDLSELEAIDRASRQWR